jgi:ABC-type multidrug transport system fused ATPase/permease subunit
LQLKYLVRFNMCHSLLCNINNMLRALLSKYDKLIQQTIKDNFNDLTALTIAHRLNTIMGADKILLMDSGKVMEFALPYFFITISPSYFSQYLLNDPPISYNI